MIPQPSRRSTQFRLPGAQTNLCQKKAVSAESDGINAAPNRIERFRAVEQKRSARRSSKNNLHVVAGERFDRAHKPAMFGAEFRDENGHQVRSFRHCGSFCWGRRVSMPPFCLSESGAKTVTTEGVYRNDL